MARAPGKAFVRWLVIAACIVPVTGLLLGFANAWSPLADSLSHFRIPLLALTGLAIPALAAARAWRMAGAAVIAALVGLGGVLPVILSDPAPGGDGNGVQGKDFTFIQLNLRFTNSGEETARFIADSGADILTLQEVSNRTRWILAALKPLYPYQAECKFATVGGVAILSKFPPVPERGPACVEGSGAVWLQVSVHGRPVSVASVHLHWPWPFGQWRHVGRLDRMLRTAPRPVIVGGDFNAAPWSNSVSRLAKAAEASPVGGLRFTLYKRLSRWGPAIGLPIDHVLAGQDVRAIEAKLGPHVGSDHQPVIVRFAVD